MKTAEKAKAIQLRQKGYSLNEIRQTLGVAKSSVSLWVRDVQLTESQKHRLAKKGFYRETVELRRTNRLRNEKQKRDKVILAAKQSIPTISKKQLWLIGVMLYWAEGGKTQRTVRFSNGDPEMIKIMTTFFRAVCEVPEEKFRGYIHIHPHLDHKIAEQYWSQISGVPLSQFFKTYCKPNKSSQNKRDSLPYGVFDLYVLDTKLFFTIVGWAQGIFSSYKNTKMD